MIRLSHQINALVETKGKKFRNEAGQEVNGKKVMAKVKSLKKLLDERRKRQALFLNVKCAIHYSFVATLRGSCGCYRLILEAKSLGSYPCSR